MKNLTYDYIDGIATLYENDIPSMVFTGETAKALAGQAKESSMEVLFLAAGLLKAYAIATDSENANLKLLGAVIDSLMSTNPKDVPTIYMLLQLMIKGEDKK